MSAKVLIPTAILLSVAYVQPTAQPTYVEPSAQVAYVEASAFTSWVDVQVTAEVTMPDVLAVDIINPADAVAKETIKQFADSFAVTEDELVQVVQKVVSEAVTPTDVVNVLLIYQRSFTDAFTALDALSHSVDKNLVDYFTSIDDISFSTSKSFADSVGMVDNMDTDIKYLIIKTISELVYTSDTHIIEAVLVKADSVTMGSSGLLVMQDYCDITYFAEDYVGQSRTFT